MKVISELVEYLRARNLLDDGNLVRLMGDGYVPTTLVYCATCGRRIEAPPGGGNAVSMGETPKPPPQASCGCAPASAPPSSDLQERLEGARRARRGGKGKRPAPRDVEPAEIAARITAMRAASAGPLEGLRAFAARLRARATLKISPQILRQATPTEIEAALETTLRADRPTLPALWTALTFDGPWQVVGRGDGGPAPRAYEQLLRHGDVPDPRAVWIRREPEVAWALGIVAAQDAVLRAHAPLLERASRLVGRALGRHRSVEAYWTLTVVYTALGLRTPDEGTVPAGWPSEEVDDPAISARAWESALRIAREPVARLLRAHAPEKARATLPIEHFVCPESWNDDARGRRG